MSAMGSFRIAVAGCGPAGLAAALLLRRDGHDVTLFERFEAPRPIGSGLMIQPTGMAVLRRLGLDTQLLAHGARIDRLLGHDGGSLRAVLDVRYTALGRNASIGASFGVGVHRAALFQILHAAAVAERIPLLTRRAITGSELEADGRRRLLLEAGGGGGPFDLIVDALGTRTPLAPPAGRALAYGALWASLDWPAGAGFDACVLQQRYRAASVMAGVLPIGTSPGSSAVKLAFFWSLRADRLEEWRRAGLGAWKRDVAALWPETAPLLDQIETPDQLAFAHYAHRTLARPAERGMIHIGDAWHSASPQLGQGANMALLDAYALALSLRGQTDINTAIRRAVAMRTGHVRLYQTMTALVTPLYQSDGRLAPFLRDRVLGPMARLWPMAWIQAATVSGLIGGPLAKLRL